jgi:hypothetical protein
MTKVGNEIFILAAAVLFAGTTLPVKYMSFVTVLALVAYILSKSVATVTVIFVTAILLRIFTQPYSNTKSVGLPDSEVKPSRYTEQQREGFQPKDPISIHQRISKEKTPAPLNPNTNVVTGVLESPEILSSLQISAVSPVEQGAAGSVRPASLKAPEIIPTPPELTPSVSSAQTVPISNPVLQNGPDKQGVLTALATKGTSLFSGQPSSEVHGASKSGPSAP